ncbi:Hypothetical predicted protein [Olea europaea subsp. europaea]|uniref:Uncharacterized protein n=1 Tax=Olea europaea subsp. europaea TaxID=158383 RepID=A0A8S0RUM2_OLEEU|nr:Hypothetical predicted protein [Olea europaea subsp. europaea]
MEKEITYTVHDFPISVQVWAYEALPEVGEHFAQRVDDIARTIVALQFNVSGDGSGGGGHVAREDPDDEAPEGTSISDHDGEDTGKSDGDRFGVDEDTCRGDGGTSSSPPPSRGPSPERRSTIQARAFRISAQGLIREDVEELLLDKRILFEMRLRTMKLEIQQHVSSKYTSLQEFLGTLVAQASSTIAVAVTSVETEVSVSGSLPEDVYGRPAEPFSDEQDIPIDTGNMQAHIVPSQDNVNLPVATAREVQDAGAIEPSNATGDDNDEGEGCDAMNGDGAVTEVLAPRSIPKARAEVSIMRRRSAQLRQPAVATRTSYTGGG